MNHFFEVQSNILCEAAFEFVNGKKMYRREREKMSYFWACLDTLVVMKIYLSFTCNETQFTVLISKSRFK